MIFNTIWFIFTFLSLNSSWVIYVSLFIKPKYMNNLLMLIPVVVFASCNHNGSTLSGTQKSSVPLLKQFTISSPAYKNGENIPPVYTCDSSDVSPELHWDRPEGKVVSYVLIMDDPDAPMGTWVHWVVYNIPANDTTLAAHYPADSVMPDGIKQGITSFGKPGYGGPCPPNGSHRYFVKLFAVDTTFGLPCATTGEKTLTAAMRGHIISSTELMGRYQRQPKH